MDWYKKVITHMTAHIRIFFSVRFTESPTNEFENQQAPCNTMKGGKNLNSGSSGRGFGIATSKGSGLREPINMAILKLRESGKLGKRLN